MVLWWWVAFAALVAGAVSCPEHCACFTDQDGYRSANCSTLALGTVAPSSLDLLSFQPHQPGYSTRLTPRAFMAFRRVKFLWLTNCSVLGLPNEVFQGLDFVIKMDLSYNKIRHLNGGVFKSLGSLHSLLLRGNPLALTPWDVIVSDSLQELDLGHCGIRTIPQGTFISAPRLSRLYLDGNHIHSFTFNMIPAGLRYLNLAHNRIVKVPTDVLKTMSFLRKLDLSKNPIKCNCALLIMQDWFSGQGIIFENGVTCSEPAQYAGHQLSKINENELCSLEEVKRQRKVNDIKNYSDSKGHRTNNMIHDPDLQSDQPDGDMYSEVLFDNEGTRILGTHMEVIKPPYVPPADFSDENNRLAASKHDLAHPEMAVLSHIVGLPKYNESHKDIEHFSTEILYMNSTDSFSETSTEDLSFVKQGSLPNNFITESLIKNNTDNIFSNATFLSESPTDSPESEMADEGYSPFYSSTPRTVLNREEYLKILNDSLLEGALSDEGYSAANNITQEEEAGSGDEELEVKEFSTSSLSNNDSSLKFPSSTQHYSWSTSNNESSDYSYDTQHDYSGEEHVTQSLSTELFEGSGASEDEEAVNKTVPPYLNDDITTSSDGYLKVETSTDVNSYSDSTTEYSFSGNSVSISSSPETSSSGYVTDLEETNESTTQNLVFSSSENPVTISSSESIVPVFDASSTPEASSSSSTDLVVVSTADITSSTNPPLSSSSEVASLPVVVEKEVIASTTQTETRKASSPTPIDTLIPENTTPGVEPPAVNEVELINRMGKNEEKEQIKVEAKQAEKGGRMELTQSTLTYVIAGLLIILIILVIATVMCKKMLRMGPCTSKKKVRLPKDTEANHGTEMQDMLLPKPPENGVKIIPQNGTSNGKEIKEEEVPVLQKDWEEKPEPIETVTARMSILAGPQTPVFIHKTLA